MSWNKNDTSNQRTTSRSRRGVPFVLFVAFVALAVLCGVAMWWWANRGENAAPKPKAPRGGAVIAEVKPASAPRPAQAESVELPKATNEPGQVVEEKKPGVFAPGMIRLPNGFELRFKLPAEGETRQLLAGGEIWEVDSKGNIQNVTPPPVFEKPFEGMISSLYERDGMVLPFALKRYSEKEVRAMCKEPTLSYDDDTPEITRKRENVAALKKAILDFLDGGGTFEEFVDDMLQHSQKAQRAQIEGVHGVRDLLEAGKDKEAVQYYRLFSQDMSDKGYGELKLPRSYRAALEEIAAKEKNRK